MNIKSITAAAFAILLFGCDPQEDKSNQYNAESPPTETPDHDKYYRSYSRPFEYEGRRYSLIASCEQAPDRTVVKLELNLIGDKTTTAIFGTSATTAASSRCQDIASLDDDFDGDGLPDAAIMNAPLEAEATKQIYLLNVNDRIFHSAGNLPMDVEPGKFNGFIATELSGSGKFKTEYFIQDKSIVIGDSYELLMDGAICLDGSKNVSGRNACDKSTTEIIAYPEAPICIFHADDNEAVVDIDRCS